jgi:hypothetical protein
MVAFSNPVAGHIYAKGEAHPAGTFVVTATFGQIDAYHLTPHQGIDVGNGGCGALVFSMGAGVISLVKLGTVGATTSDKASIVRVKHPNGWETGVAHLKVATGLAVGQAVFDGYPLGTCDKIGATACHVHFGVKDPSGTEVDAWPLLRQNGATEADMIPIPTAAYTRLANKKSSLIANGNFRDARSNGAVLKLYPSGTVIYPVASASDGSVPTGSTSSTWFYCILYDDSPAGYIGGWFHSSLVGPLVDDVAATDCTAAVKLATDPLNVKIASLSAADAAKAAKITNAQKALA